MKPRKARIKKQLIIQHRENEYLHAINKVMDGRAEPSYASERWNKLREAQGK